MTSIKVIQDRALLDNLPYDLAPELLSNLSQDLARAVLFYLPAAVTFELLEAKVIALETYRLLYKDLILAVNPSMTSQDKFKLWTRL